MASACLLHGLEVAPPTCVAVNTRRLPTSWGTPKAPGDLAVGGCIPAILEGSRLGVTTRRKISNTSKQLPKGGAFMRSIARRARNLIHIWRSPQEPEHTTSMDDGPQCRPGDLAQSKMLRNGPAGKHRRRKDCAHRRCLGPWQDPPKIKHTRQPLWVNSGSDDQRAVCHPAHRAKDSSALPPTPNEDIAFAGNLCQHMQDTPHDKQRGAWQTLALPHRSLLTSSMGARWFITRIVAGVARPCPNVRMVYAHAATSSSREPLEPTRAPKGSNRRRLPRATPRQP